MALFGPQIERLLHEIRRRVRVSAQAEPKAVKRRVVAVDELLKGVGAHVQMRRRKRSFIPGESMMEWHGQVIEGLAVGAAGAFYLRQWRDLEARRRKIPPAL